MINNKNKKNMYLYYLILLIDLILLYNKSDWFEFNDIWNWEFNLNNIGFFLFNWSASLIISFIIFLVLLPFILRIEFKLCSYWNKKNTIEKSEELKN